MKRIIKEIIEIKEDIRIPGTDVILEKGDKIEVESEEKYEIKESMQREALIFKATDGRWYYFIAYEEYGEWPNGSFHGPFSSEDSAYSHMRNNHSSPGGYRVDDSGTMEVPKTTNYRNSTSRFLPFY